MMKKLIVVAIAVLFTFGMTSCKKVNVPEQVKTSFSKIFPKAIDIEWKQKKNNRWEAEFDLKEKEISATFDNKGTWLKTETEIETAAIPETVKKSLQAKFNNYKVEESTYIETPELKGYEVDLKGKSGDKIKVLFDKDGKGLKRKRVTDED